MSETYTHSGFDITIMQDDMVGSPRTEYDNMGKMICFHSRHNLGDEHSYNSPEEAMADILFDLGLDQFSDTDVDQIMDTMTGVKMMELLEEHAVVLPVYLYDHSGLTVSTTGFSCPWDSSQVGIIYTTNKQARDEYKSDTLMQAREKARKYLVGEVETYDQFLTGDVWGFRVERNGIELDSCWGFYGQKHCIDEATSIADWHADDRWKARLKKLKALIRQHVPFGKRKDIMSRM